MKQFVGGMLLMGIGVGAMPYSSTLEFRAGSGNPCLSATSSPPCSSIGNNNCTGTYLSCSGGATNNAKTCFDGAGGQAAGCDGTKDCGAQNNASRSTDCN